MDADLTTLARTGDPVRHAAASRALSARGETWLARGAANLAAVAAYRLAAAPSPDDRAFRARVGRLRDIVSELDAGRRAHVVALVDAALAAEAEARTSVGLAPHGGRLHGWVGEALAGAAVGWAVDEGPGATAPEAEAAYAAACLVDDVDLVLARAIRLLRGMVASGGSTPAGLDALEAEAFALCARPSESPAERADRRRTLLILWLTLRHRRPLAAAVLRAQLRQDRIPPTPIAGDRARPARRP